MVMSFTVLENTKGITSFIISFSHLFTYSTIICLILHGREILSKYIPWTLERSAILGNADFMVPRDTPDGYMGLKSRKFSQFDIHMTE